MCTASFVTAAVLLSDQLVQLCQQGVVARLAESRQGRISARAAHLEQLQQAAQEEMLADCTFRPAVTHRRKQPQTKVCIFCGNLDALKPVA